MTSRTLASGWQPHEVPANGRVADAATDNESACAPDYQTAPDALEIRAAGDRRPSSHGWALRAFNAARRHGLIDPPEVDLARDLLTRQAVVRRLEAAGWQLVATPGGPSSLIAMRSGVVAFVTLSAAPDALTPAQARLAAACARCGVVYVLASGDGDLDALAPAEVPAS